MALRKPVPDIPVILASGYDEAQVMAGDHTEWPQAFLGKPYKFKGLSEAISQALINKKEVIAKVPINPLPPGGGGLGWREGFHEISMLQFHPPPNPLPSREGEKTFASGSAI